MDRLRLGIAETDADGGDDFQVLIYVNDVEMTAIGAGLGMDPYDVLVPDNLFVARDEPHTIPVARCTCGVYGCGMTDATITREGDRVRWDWDIEVPIARPVVFDAAEYAREVERIGGDHSWETPERTAGRLVLTSTGPEELPDGLVLDWAGNDWRDERRFVVCLRAGDEHQIFIGFDWLDRTPGQLAAEVRRVLIEEPPARWPAAWHSIKRTGRPPAVAGDDWTEAPV